jgi:hypothetical protein
MEIGNKNTRKKQEKWGKFIEKSVKNAELP